MAPQYRVTIERIESTTTELQLKATEVYRQTFADLYVPEVIRMINSHAEGAPHQRLRMTAEEMRRILEDADDARGKGKSA